MFFYILRIINWYVVSYMIFQVATPNHFFKREKYFLIYNSLQNYLNSPHSNDI